MLQRQVGPLPVRRRDLVISILVLFNLALAQPVLDLIGRNAQFLVAHDASRPQIILLVLVLTALIPLVIGVVAIVLQRWSPRAGGLLHALVLAILVTALVLRVFKEVAEDLPAVVMAAVAVVAGTLFVKSFYSHESVRSFLRIGLPIPLLVAGLFAFASPASKLVFPEDAEVTSSTAASRKTPVVVMVFDELPVASLMTRDLEVDARLFPNFARLRRDSTWYRNATTVDDATTYAVPAILDGGRPRKGQLPILADHPQNLFTLLAPTHRIAAVEPITGMCPVDRCGKAGAETGPLVSDLRVLALRVILPDDLADPLPPLTDTWAGFAQPQAAGVDGRPRARGLIGAFDREEQVGDLAASIRRRPQRSLYFVHVLLPHIPWEYLPSGRRYLQNDVPGRTDHGWVDDRWLVMQGYQRHLLQLRFTDRLLGRVLERLRREDLYDKALVIALADHGAAFRPGNPVRDGDEETVGSVASIPLFVKRPFQSKPEVVDAPVETIDVLPTILDVLEIEPAEPLDGRSLLSRNLPQDRLRSMPLEEVTIGPSGKEKLAEVRNKYELLGRALVDLFALAPPGLNGLIGRPVDAVELGEPTSGRGAIDDAASYSSLRPGREGCRCLVQGRLRPSPPGETAVAIAVNGVIRGVTEVAETGRFASLLAPEVFVKGDNDFNLYLVEDRGPTARLRPVEEGNV